MTLIQKSLRVGILVGLLAVAAHCFTLPHQKSPIASPSVVDTVVGNRNVALRLSLPFQKQWNARRRSGNRQEHFRNSKKVVNQSTYELGPQDYTDDATARPFEISSKRLRIENKWREHKLKRAAQVAALHEEQEVVAAKQEDATGATKGGATVLSSTMNLAKVILGTGVLALPSGLAAVSDFPIALVPASILLVVLGGFSAYTFQLYGRLTHETQASSLGEMWERTKGKDTSWIISASTFSFCFGIALTYSLVIGDFLSNLAMSFGSGVPTMLTQRQFWILGVTLFTLLPLCNLKSLAALAPMSILGTVGTILTTIFMALRCPAIFAGSPYSVASGAVGKFAAAALAATPSLAPKFNTFSQIVSPAALIIAAMATTAYLGHFNAPEFYHGFKSKKSKPATETTATSLSEDEQLLTTQVEKGEKSNRKMALNKFGKMTGIGFAGVTIMNILILAFGFLTFGGNCAGVVLNNYATADRGAVISRLLMTLSVIGGYPFMVGGCKSTFAQLYNDVKGKAASPKMQKWFVRSLLFVVTSLALLVSDAGLVVSLNGALMGSAIIYVFPALMFLSHTSNQVQEAGGRISRKLKLERFASRFLVTFGVVSGLIGAAVSVVNACAPHLLR